MRQSAQTLGHFITLQARRRIGASIAQRHGADFHASTLGHVACLPHDGLQLIHKAIDRRGHIADFILAVDLHALGEVALAGRQIIHRGNQQLQAIDHASPQHNGDQQQYPKPHQCQPHADAPAQGARRVLHGAGGIGRHLRGSGLRRLQPGAHGVGAVSGGSLEAVTHQLITAGDQRGKALIQGLQVGFNRRGRHAHAHLADFHTVGADGGFDVIHGGVCLGRVQHLVQGTFPCALCQQGLVDRVFAVQVSGQVLACGVVIHHKQHIGVALGPAGKL